jgi:hypothetical protein
VSINITDNDHSEIVSYIISNPEFIMDEIIPTYFENIDFDDYKEFKKKCDEIFDEINSELDNDEFPNLNLHYDEQLIEIENQDIQFAFEKLVNRKDRNSLTDLIQIINQNTK